MTITITPAATTPAIPPPSGDLDSTPDPTDDGFAALFALVAVPIPVNAPPTPGATADTGQPPDDAATSTSPPQDGPSTAPSAPSTTKWETTAADAPIPKDTLSLPPKAVGTAIRLLNGDARRDKISTALTQSAPPVTNDATADLADTAPPTNDAAANIEPAVATAAKPYADDLRHLTLANSHDDPTPPLGTNAPLSGTEPPPTDAPLEDDAATIIKPTAETATKPHAGDPRHLALTNLHDGPTPAPDTNATLSGGEPLPPDATSRPTPMPTVDAADPSGLSPTGVATTANLVTAATAATRVEEPTTPATRDHHEQSAAPSSAITGETPAVTRLAPPTPPPPVAAPVVPSQVATVVADHIRQSGPGRHRLEITLHPPELGRIEVHLVVSTHSVHAHLMAQSEAGRDALAHHIPTLREQLAAHGFTDAQVGVDLSGRGGGHQQRWQPQSPPHPATATAVEELPITATHQPPATPKRLLDRVV